MVSISGSKKLKRQMAPQFWGITRKNKRFVITVKPGSHKKNHSIPTAVFLRDTLRIVTTLREAKTSIYSGSVKVDGIVRKSLHHSIGLMDVVETKGHLRCLPSGPNRRETLAANKDQRIGEDKKTRQSSQQDNNQRCKTADRIS